MMSDRRSLLTLMMLAIFAAAVGIALTLPSKAAFMPFLVGVPGTLLCAGQLVLDLRRGGAIAAAKPRAPDEGRSEAEMFGWLGAFTGILIGLGFLAGGPLVVALFVRLSARESWANTAVAALGTFLILYGVFTTLLGLHLFPGLLVMAF